MQFLLETPNGAYGLRVLIFWSFLILFNAFYVFLTRPKLTLVNIFAYVICLGFIAFVIGMQIPNPSNKDIPNTTQIVTWNLIFGIALYGSVGLLLWSQQKWSQQKGSQQKGPPVATLTAFGGISVVLSALFGYLCANDAGLYDSNGA